LQRGFIIKSRAGCTIEEFLHRELKLNTDYIQNKISTIFLDGKPVDDITKAMIEDGSILSLSGAMPGLVGAVMRRSSYYASFRDSISYKPPVRSKAQKESSLCLRLFNMILYDLGPKFLQKGILITLANFSEYIKILSANAYQGVDRIILNNKVVDHNFLKDLDNKEQNQLVCLTIQQKGV
jgi:hypothetical protein